MTTFGAYQKVKNTIVDVCWPCGHHFCTHTHTTPSIVPSIDCESAAVTVDLGVKKDIVKTFYLSGACPVFWR